MIDVTIIGGGSNARACTDLLSAAGFGLRRTFEFDNEDRSPVILGEIPAAWNMARQAVEAGRHLLIANPAMFSPERIGLLYESRRRAQALFLWSTRRHHPSYRFVSSLIESDSIWQPRHLRHETLMTESPAVGVANWALAEASALVVSLSGESPLTVAATGASNPMRNANELTHLSIAFPSMRAFLLLGLGEAMERRETLIAGDTRRIFIDELNASVPVRLISDDATTDTPASRWLSTSSPTAAETARQQVISFLDSTLRPEQTQEEATLWTRAFAVIVAARQSLLNGGGAVEVEQRDSGAPPFRVIA